MKYTNLFPAAFILSLLIALTGCEKAKELIIIDGNLPIKTSTLYMVGDATPNGWNIDAPTPLEANGEDPLVFTWEGELYAGEMKLCLTPGSWNAPFIRPVNNGTAISKTDITDAVFDMHAGDPDSKWKITDAGVYSLTFDLRNWTMSTVFVRDLDGPTIEPIETETLYMIGDATPGGWSMDDATEFTVDPSDKYIFTWEGELKEGELKMCLERDGTFSCPFIRPASNGCKISATGIEATDFVFYANDPDNKWAVTDAGRYRITLDLRHRTIATEFMN